MDFVLDSLPGDVMSVPYPCHNYETPRYTLNNIFQAKSIGQRYQKTVKVPLQPDPVLYVSLDDLLDKSIPSEETQ